MNMTLAKTLYQFREFLRIAFARLRAVGWKLAGVQVQGKCLFGKGVHFDHPWCTTVGHRCMFQPGVWLNVGAPTASLQIGEYTFIGRGAEIEVAEKVIIGKQCLIAPGVFITDHNHDIRRGRPMFEKPCLKAPVKIGDDVWIGVNACILPGVSIGDGAVVAAGAVVNRSVAAHTVVGGVPAKVIGSRSSDPSQAASS